jgi:peptidoglycan/LPS O-acetylase OafA/YrhL
MSSILGGGLVSKLQRNAAPLRRNSVTWLTQPPRIGLTLSNVIVANLSLGLTLVGWVIHIPVLSGLYHTLSLPFFFYLVSGAACDFRGVIGAVLSSRALGYIGQISYGLYVIHGPIYWLIPYFTRWTNHGTIASIIAAGVTIALASLSWRYFEGPINRQRGAVVDALFGQRLRHANR